MWENYYTLCLNQDKKLLQQLLNQLIEKNYSFLDIIHSFLNDVKFNIV